MSLGLTASLVRGIVCAAGLLCVAAGPAASAPLCPVEAPLSDFIGLGSTGCIVDTHGTRLFDVGYSAGTGAGAGLTASDISLSVHLFVPDIRHWVDLDLWWDAPEEGEPEPPWWEAGAVTYTLEAAGRFSIVGGHAYPEDAYPTMVCAAGTLPDCVDGQLYDWNHAYVMGPGDVFIEPGVRLVDVRTLLLPVGRAEGVWVGSGFVLVPEPALGWLMVGALAAIARRRWRRPATRKPPKLCRREQPR
jgi:hypothetical protein